VNAARITQVSLWAIAALLLVATVWPFVMPVTGGGEASLLAGRPSKPFTTPAVGDLALPPQETFSATLSRPLFTATRRPPSPLATLQGQAGPPPEPSTPVVSGPKGARLVLGAYYLRGVVLAPERKIVLFQHQATGRSLRLAEGEKLDGWTVATIAANEVVLRNGERKEAIPLHERK
jgi:hypothetical protein